MRLIDLLLFLYIFLGWIPSGIILFKTNCKKWWHYVTLAIFGVYTILIVLGVLFIAGIETLIENRKSKNDNNEL